MDKKIALALTVYYAALVWSRIHLGMEHNLWWVSHAVIPLAAFGFFRGSDLILSGALTLIVIPHTLWIIGFILTMLGLPNMGIADYMATANIWTWGFTMHHLIILPLLLWRLWGKVSDKGWMVSTGYFAIISFGAIFTNPLYNVNCAHRVCETAILEPFYFVNALPQMAYWVTLNVVAAIFVFIPSNSVLRKIKKIKEI